MTQEIETTGRRTQAIDLRLAPVAFLLRSGPLPLRQPPVQRLASGRTGAGERGRPPPIPAEAEAIERETPLPSPDQVAERVYRLLCQDLRLDRERQGR